MHNPMNDLAASTGCGGDEPNLAEVVRRLTRASLLVVGDAMLDRHVHGRLAQTVGNPAVPVLGVEREVALPDGAANVVRHLTGLGAAVSFVSVIGDDQTGSDLTALIGGQPGVEPWLLVQGGRTTTLRTRYIADGVPILRADQQDTGRIQPKLAERLLRIARDAMAWATAMILSDFGNGVLAGDAPAELIGAARQFGRVAIASPHEADPGRYAGADVLFLDSSDLGQNGPLSEAEVALAAGALRERHGFPAVILFRRNSGITLAERDGISHYGVDRAELTPPPNCADAVLATLAAALAVGMTVGVAARVASSAAQNVAARSGPLTTEIDGLKLPRFDSLTAVSDRAGGLQPVKQ